MTSEETGPDTIECWRCGGVLHRDGRRTRRDCYACTKCSLRVDAPAGYFAGEPDVREGGARRLSGCAACGAVLPAASKGRWRKFCSPACRQRAYRRRLEAGGEGAIGGGGG